MSDATPLPSRDIAYSALQRLAYPEDGDRDVINHVMSSFILGRLVDRETINYEAADKALLHVVIASLEALDTVFQLESGAARTIVDAALEVTDA
jgi:hypothetical protein